MVRQGTHKLAHNDSERFWADFEDDPTLLNCEIAQTSFLLPPPCPPVGGPSHDTSQGWRGLGGHACSGPGGGLKTVAWLKMSISRDVKSLIQPCWTGVELL